MYLEYMLHITEASFLIFSLTGMMYLVFSLGTSFEATPESERILLVILCVCTSMMTLLAVSKIYRRWKYDVSRVELELLSPGPALPQGRCVYFKYI